LEKKLFAYFKLQKCPVAHRQLRALSFREYCVGLDCLTHHTFVRVWKGVLKEMARMDEEKFLFVMNECFRMGIK
jgi:hypothetical protein